MNADFDEWAYIHILERRIEALKAENERLQAEIKKLTLKL